MSDQKKTADELLFEEENDKPVFRSMAAQGVLLDDIIQKNKV